MLPLPPVGRVHAVKICEPGFDGWAIETWRLYEGNGTLCVNWLPGLELDDDEGPLDRGGFEGRRDATAFALGIDWIRAEAGQLPGLTTRDIDAERRLLDGKQALPELDDWDVEDEPPSHLAARQSPEPAYSYLGPSWLF